MRGIFGSTAAFLISIIVVCASAACGGADAESTAPTGADTSATDGDSDSAESTGETEAGPEPAFPPAGPDAAPDPAEVGPYAVGVRTFTYYDDARPTDDDSGGGPRKLVTEIWYPTTAVFDPSLGKVYDPKTEAVAFDPALAQVIGDAVIGNFQSNALADAPLWPGVKFPMIIYSHGSGAIRYQSVFHTINMASHGYIVVAVDHIGNTLWELLRDGWNEGAVGKAWPKRQDDVVFILNQIEKENAESNNWLFGAVDMDNVGAAGHSFGAVTSEIFGCIDDRVKIVISEAPISGFSEVKGCPMAEYPKPIMIMGGTADQTLEYEANMLKGYQMLGPPAWMITIVDGGHFTFSDLCLLDLAKLAHDLNWSDAEDALKDGCSTTLNVDWNVAHVGINHYAVALMNLYLRNSEGSRQYLKQYDTLPLNVIQYQEKLE